MTTAPESFAHYNAAWNEPDPARVRARLDLAVTDDVVFADPANHTLGILELEAMICKASAHRRRGDLRRDGLHHGRLHGPDRADRRVFNDLPRTTI